MSKKSILRSKRKLVKFQIEKFFILKIKSIENSLYAIFE